MTINNTFSIVIPTMWGSEYLLKMFEYYENSPLVSEIILIDNNPQLKPDLSNFSKIIYYTEDKNIFVNPAWNIGHTLSSHKLILANDDILMPNVDDVLKLILNNLDYDIIGLDWGYKDELEIKEIKNFGIKGYGCFMYIKNYISIPYMYKIWRGDFIQFSKANKRGVILNPELRGDISKTVESTDELKVMAKKDAITYNKLKKNPKKDVLFVLVNYGGEQINYLEKVVKTIKSFINYNCHIIVHTNIPLDIEGIDEVKIYDDLSNYQLLPLTCRQTIIDNKDKYDLYVYGENDHLFEEHHLDNHIEYYEILPKDRISGLIQFEVNEYGEKFYPAYFKNFEWDFESVEEYGGKKFAHFSNLHQATFIINNEQLEYISSLYDFNSFFDRSSYSAKCKVNTDIYQFCGMKKVICISDFKSNLIHHLPNLYIYGDKGRNKNQTSDDNRMKESIKKLLYSKPNYSITNVDIVKLPTKKESSLSKVKSVINDFNPNKKVIEDKNDYDKINKLLNKNNPKVSTQKPITQNKPMSRNEINELRKDSLVNIAKKLQNVRPTNKNATPHVFGGRSRQ